MNNFSVSLDPFTITLIFILVSALITVFIKGRAKDRCLSDFNDYEITVEMKDGKRIWGKCKVETTGIELLYDSPYDDNDGHIENSFILYKNEFTKVHAFIRFHDKLSEKNQKQRALSLKKTYHPNIFRRTKRSFRNFFSTVKDSMMDAVNMISSKVQKGIPQDVLASSNKYINQIQKETVEFVSYASYDPLLERQIGKKVVLELPVEAKIKEYVGILKEYTSEFLEVLDILYPFSDEDPKRKADIVISRQIATIRHLAE